MTKHHVETAPRFVLPGQSDGPFWHHELVGGRLIEAASTMRRLPMRIWPKQFGTIWPAYEPMTADELYAMKVEILKTHGQERLDAWEREQNRIQVSPSAAEIERAEEALGWPIKYLAGDRETAQAVGFWASKTFDIEEADIPPFVRDGLRTISRGLKRDNVRVRA